MKRRSLVFALAAWLFVTPLCAQVSPPVLRVEDGGTGASNPGTARTNLGAAAAGANSDITSLNGLTTVLPSSEGGTGSTGGVSPTGSLTTTPEAVINIADFGGCSGSAAVDTANINAAFTAARSSAAYAANQPVRVIGGFAATGVACAVTQVNVTGFTRFGGGARLIVEDLSLVCSGAGNICVDTIGSLNVQFNRVTIVGLSGSPPMIGLQEGNIAPATIACCIHTHYGLEITGSFTFAALYSAASESTTYFAPIIRNNGASTGVIGSLGAVTGGSGYTNGTYTGVLLSGSGTGQGALANIVVAGGAVSSVVLTNQGKQYLVGDTLTAPNASLGGSGSGFSVPVSNVGHFAVVLDGQNHWGASSSFQTVNWPADTYYTFTENNIIGGSIRYYGNVYKGAPLWVGSVEGLRTVHVYVAQQAVGPCVYLFDNNAAYTVHNIGETLELECEAFSATYDVQLTGSNPTPNVSGLVVIDPQNTVSSGILGVDNGISGVTAHNSQVAIGRTVTNPPLFGLGTAGLWNFDGSVSLPLAWEYNAPNSKQVSGVSNGTPMSGAGPLDFVNSMAGVTGAYSCARKLTVAYTGPLCNIRRASDSASADFFPDPSGAADRSALSTFCAGTSCFIAIAYDQSGNSNPARNATTANQPALTIEGPGLNYAACGAWGSGSNIALVVNQNSSTNALFASGGFASSVVNKTATLTNSARLLSKAGAGSGWELSGAFSLGFGYPQFTVYATAANGSWVSSSFMPSSGGHIFDVGYSYASLANAPALGIDGGGLAYQSAVQPSGSISDTNNLVIGNSASGGLGWPGDICEVVLARQSLSATQIDAIRRNQAVFYGLAGVL